jgi:hypothetical protein
MYKRRLAWVKVIFNHRLPNKNHKVDAMVTTVGVTITLYRSLP